MWNTKSLGVPSASGTTGGQTWPWGVPAVVFASIAGYAADPRSVRQLRISPLRHSHGRSCGESLNQLSLVWSRKSAGGRDQRLSIRDVGADRCHPHGFVSGRTGMATRHLCHTRLECRRWPESAEPSLSSLQTGCCLSGTTCSRWNSCPIPDWSAPNRSVAPRGGHALQTGTLSGANNSSGISRFCRRNSSSSGSRRSSSMARS